MALQDFFTFIGILDTIIITALRLCKKLETKRATNQCKKNMFINDRQTLQSISENVLVLWWYLILPINSVINELGKKILQFFTCAMA